MKKWKVIKIVTSSILILWIIYIFLLAIKCLFFTSYVEIYGVTMTNGFEIFWALLELTTIELGVPILVDIIFLVISIKKDKNKN